MVRLFLSLLLLLPSFAYSAISPAVPSIYQDLYSSIDANLSNFEASIQSTWNRSTSSPVAFSAELESADSSQGPLLFAPYHYNGVLMELDSLKALGVKAVTVSLDFPVLYSGYYQNQSDFQRYISFYKQLATDIRTRNMKFIAKATVVFSQSAYTNLNVKPYYNSLSLDQYEQGRMAAAQTIVQNFHPDYLSVISEPDTEASQTGKSQLGTVAGSTALLNIILNGLAQTGTSGTKIGAGVGSWTSSYQSYIQSFASTAVDFIDVHVYPINLDYLPRLIQIADLAASYQKPVAISEAWLTKVRDSELISLPADLAFARDPYSFWSPLDIRFLSVLMKYAYEKNLLFISPSWSEWLHGYLDYNSVSSLTSSQVITAGMTLASQQIAAGQYSPTGLSYAQALIQPADHTAPTVPTSVWGAAVSTGVNILWNASTDSVGVAGYRIFRDGTQIATTAATYYQDTTATPATSHRYQIAAYDASGNASALSASVLVKALTK